MNATQAENARAIIRHMESKPVERLFMPLVVHPCGTPACALGHAATARIAGFSYEAGCLRRNDERVVRLEEVTDAFGLPFHQFFGGRLYTADGAALRDPTPAQWADEARMVLAEHGYTMDDDKPAMTFERFMEIVRKPVLTSTEEAGAKLDGEATYR